ncbi:hypothetical protein AU476_24285 [Cupriavidus sp. UYMSc13B]|nr:hypothetical protein AU476_24285 [Cupriavidus sp. UYMSc13B]
MSLNPRWREAQRKDDKKPRGKDPKPPQGSVKERDQINLTEQESRIMPVSRGGFEQGYNAQAADPASANGRAANWWRRCPWRAQT